MTCHKPLIKFAGRPRRSRDEESTTGTGSLHRVRFATRNETVNKYVNAQLVKFHINSTERRSNAVLVLTN